MDRRIAQGPVPSGPPHAPLPDVGDEPASPTTTVLVGLGIVAAVLLVYVFSNPQRPNLYNHFVWQAAAWLQGQGTIPYPAPASGGLPGNGYFQDVLPVVDASGVPTGRAILPFPPADLTRSTPPRGNDDRFRYGLSELAQGVRRPSCAADR